MKLAVVDVGHLELFKKTLRAEQPIFPVLATACSGPGVGIEINSPAMVSSLGRFGIVPRKAHTVSWPCELSDAMAKHFWRGMFDGDGHFNWKLRIGYTPQLRVGVTGNMFMLGGMQEFLVAQLPYTTRTKLVPDRGSFKLEHGGNKKAVSIARWLYQDATVFLRRKYDKVAHVL